MSEPSASDVTAPAPVAGAAAHGTAAAVHGGADPPQVFTLPAAVIHRRFGLTAFAALGTCAVLVAFDQLSVWVAVLVVLGLALGLAGLARRAVQVPHVMISDAGVRGRMPGQALGWATVSWSEPATLTPHAQGMLPGWLLATATPAQLRAAEAARRSPRWRWMPRARVAAHHGTLRHPAGRQVFIPAAVLSTSAFGAAIQQFAPESHVLRDQVM